MKGKDESMKRTSALFLALLISLSLTSYAQGQTLVSYRGFDPDEQSYRDFVAAHPDVTLKGWEPYYSTTGEFVGALLTKALSSDLFDISTFTVDYRQIMKKGYLLDLSGSSVIREAISRMHPSIAAQTMLDGKIYAVPTRISFDYMEVNRDGWAQAGLSEADVPDSFPAFLDFLEHWCDQTEKSGDQNIRVNMMWDWDLYNEDTYPYWLSRHLINSYILQQQYAGEPLTFDELELRGLLERCQEVGRRLYAVEPKIEGEYPQGIYYALFETGLQMAWPQRMAYVLNFRLNDAQPKLMKAWMSMSSVNAETKVPDLSIEFLERMVTAPQKPTTWTSTLLYRDAEPKLNPNHEASLKSIAKQLNAIREKLADPDLPIVERQEQEELLKQFEYHEEHANDDENKYYMSPAQLEEYKQYADGLFFPPPGVFDSSSESYKQIDTLQKQFGARVITTDQFMSELKRIARIVELENQ